MSKPYPSLKAALADHPHCIGLHLTLTSYPGNDIRLAFADGQSWRLEKKEVDFQETDFACVLSQTHWQVLEMRMEVLQSGFDEWLEKILQFSSFTALRRLQVHYPYGFKHGKLSLAGLKELEEVDLKELKVELTDPLVKVHTFLLDSFTAVHVPDILAKLNPQVLRQADFRHCELTEIPRELARFAHLEYLGLTGNKIQTLPPEILQLKKLRYLNLNSNRIAQLPAEVMQLDRLEELLLNHNPLTDDTKIKSKTVLLKTIHWCAAQQTPLAQRKVLLDLMQGNQAAVERASLEELLYALGTDTELIRRKAMPQLLARVNDPFTADFESHPQTIALLGKIKGLAGSEITAQLKTKGIKVQNRLSDNVTLVCLGEALDSEQIGTILNRKLPIALPQHLKDFLMRLETPYLKEADTDTHENLLRLLLSDEESNTKLAVQMMLTGGIPDALFYHVLILGMRKGTAHWKLLRPLLERYATPLQYDFIKEYRQKEIGESMEAMLKSTVFDMTALLKAALTVFYVPFDNRIKHYPPRMSGYALFREMVKKSFRTGGATARNACQALLDGTSLDLLFSETTVDDRFQFAREIVEFPQIERITCSSRCAAMPTNQKLFRQLPHLKEIVIYKGRIPLADSEKAEDALSTFKASLPNVIFTSERYV